jgi:hypothetical protein
LSFWAQFSGPNAEKGYKTNYGKDLIVLAVGAELPAGLSGRSFRVWVLNSALFNNQIGFDRNSNPHLLEYCSLFF